jgi:hypothetical protein
LTEIVIVDAESDLNVYIDMARNAQADQQVTTSSCEPSTSELSVCCEAKGRCTQEDGVGACAETGSKANACCSPSCCGRLGDIKQHADVDTKGTAAEEYDLSHVNINDWAGKYPLNLPGLTLIGEDLLKSLRSRPSTNIILYR